MKNFPRISPFGDRGILIEFEPEVSENVLNKVLFYKEKLENIEFKQKVEVINAYNSLLVNYLFTIEDVYGEISALKELFREANIAKNRNYKIYELPVCYDLEFGLDLKHISEQNELEIKEIIQLHTAPFYQVYFIGFLPGFLYLGGLDKRLQIPRKNTPRRSVKKGAVGIGENQTGIYPKSSPGGWQILGNCPVVLFDKTAAPPSPFLAGDKIKFKSVSKTEYDEIKQQISEGKYELKILDDES